MLKTSLTFREKASLRKSNDRPIVHRRPYTPPRGEQLPHAVLTEDDVRRIRRAKKPGVGAKKIQEMLGLANISLHVLNSVIRGDSWRHVTDA